jgi:replicative DNA helicase
MTADLLVRVPPQNIEAEMAVIGAVLIENGIYQPVAEILAEDDFYRESHRIIWSGIEALAAARRSIDILTLTDVLRPRLQQVGGPAYIAELAVFVPVASTAPHYARIVREKAIQRRLAQFGVTTASAAYEAPQHWSPDWTEEQIAVAEYELAAIASRLVRKPEPKKGETLATVLYNLEHGVRRGVATGFVPLDQSFGGFDIGHLTMLAARTSKGKTAFALNVALNVAKAGFETVFFTLEMTADEMWLRALGREAMVDTFSASRRGLLDDEKERLAKARQALDELPIEILYRPSMRPRDLRIECRRLAREVGNLKLVIVDYLALMRGDRHERERWREMQEVVLALKALAGDIGVPMLVLQQLNRETNENLVPSLSNLRDTGATEEHSSNVLFVWQEPKKDDDPPVYGAWEDINIIIAKQRNGPAGLRVPMRFRKCWGAFEAK